jgi:hypothetical protein
VASWHFILKDEVLFDYKTAYPPATVCTANLGGTAEKHPSLYTGWMLFDFFENRSDAFELKGNRNIKRIMSKMTKEYITGDAYDCI